MADGGVYEIAQLHIAPGQKEAFAAASRQALETISAVSGCRSANFFDCIENETEPIFIVHWDRLEDHTAFRESDSFPEYRAPIAEFFAQPPTARHYILRVTAGSDA